MACSKRRFPSTPIWLVVFQFVIGVAARVAAYNTTVFTLPNFSLHMMVLNDNDSLDLYTFRQRLDDVMAKHLKEGLENPAFVELQLRSSLRRTHDRSSLVNDDRADIYVDYEGTASFLESALSDVEVHRMVYESLSDDEFWRLWHKFIQDPVLKDIDDLIINIDATLVDPEDEWEPADRRTSTTTLIVLSVICGLLVVFMALLFLYAYRKFRQANACCSVGKESLGTYSDDESDESDHGDDDDDTQGTVLDPTSTLRCIKKKRKNRRSVVEKPSIPAKPCLSAIEEGEEDEDGSLVDGRRSSTSPPLEQAPLPPASPNTALHSRGVPLSTPEVFVEEGAIVLSEHQSVSY